MPTVPREFVLRRVVQNVSSFVEAGYVYSEVEEYFNIPWRTNVYKKNGFLSFYLHCTKSVDDCWKVSIKNEVTLISARAKPQSKSYDIEFNNSNRQNWGWSEFIGWETLEKDYVTDDGFIIEAHVTIEKMTGIEKTKLRNFDETTKEFSDVVLIVDNEKFYVSKLFLAGQSSYFKSLLMGKFKESEKSEVTLADVDPKDFQNFLEVLYGELAIDDNTITGILHLADMYDCQTVIRQCEDFLDKESDMTAKEKLEISAGYNLKKTMNKCLMKVKTVEDFKSVVAGDLTEMNPSALAALLQKSLSLHQ